MKKTISINIAGQIFYIEEDGYDKLRQYLASVHYYFSSFEDNAEIIADIESRIAERFILKQKQENKQVISVDDVSELIKAMGEVSDFEAAEQSDDFISEPLSSRARPESDAHSGALPGKRRYYRDLKRKIIGGVAAGIAHYYTLDPLWVRLILLLVFLGGVPVNGMLDTGMEDDFAILSGLLLIAYIAMWIAFPGTHQLEDTQKIKKFYRDPQNKVLGGVAAGVASYFNLDIGIVRFLWVISIFFFGTGVLIYILLWAIAPAAHTLTEKMEMQGEPITISNIESNIKRNQEEIHQVRDSDWKRLFLLPFIIIGKILNGLGKALREIGPLLRVLVGVLMVAVAVSGLFAVLVGAAALLGLASMPDFGVFPSEFLIIKETPPVLVFSVIGIIVVPIVAILLLGLMLLLNRRVVGSTFWIVLAGVFIFSIFGMISSGLVFQRNFIESGEYTQVERMKIETGVLRIDQEGNYSEQSVKVRVSIRGSHLNDSVKIEKRFTARGPNHVEARETASHLVYDLEKRDTTLFFPNGPLVADILPYRMQEIDIALEVPYHRPFVMTRQFYYGFLRNWHLNRNLTHYDLRHQDLDWESLRWVFLPDSGLVCTNFPERFLVKSTPRSSEQSSETEWSDGGEFTGVSPGDRGDFVKQIMVPAFTRVEIGGAYRVLIQKGEEPSVTLDGAEANVNALQVKVEENVVYVMKKDPVEELPEPTKRVRIVITTPQLETIDLSGTSLLRVEDFERMGELAIRLSGSTKAEVAIDVEKLNLDLSGASRMLVRGNAEELAAIASGDCILKAENLRVAKGQVSTSGVSKVYLGAVEHLDKHETGQSRIYKNGQ